MRPTRFMFTATSSTSGFSYGATSPPNTILAGLHSNLLFASRPAQRTSLVWNFSTSPNETRPQPQPTEPPSQPARKLGTRSKPERETPVSRHAFRDMTAWLCRQFVQQIADLPSTPGPIPAPSRAVNPTTALDRTGSNRRPHSCLKKQTCPSSW